MFSSVNIPALVVILDLLLKVTLFVGLIVLAERLLVRQSAALRHCLWLACFAGLVSLPVATLFLPTFRLPVLSQTWLPGDANSMGVEQSNRIDKAHEIRNPHAAASTRNNVADVTFPTQSNTTVQTIDSRLVDGANQSSEQPPSIASPSAPSAWPSYIVEAGTTVWLVGIPLTLLPLFFGFLKNAQILRRSRLVPDKSLNCEVEELMSRVQLRLPIEVRESNDGFVPMTSGVIYPTILLPGPEWKAWTDDRRRIVLLHELAHVKRKDVLWNALSRVVCTFYWFHPMIWHAHRRLRAASELACDDFVISTGVKPSEYAHHLLCTAREFRACTATFAVAMAQRSGLERRVRAILHQHGSRLPLSKLTSRTTVLVLVLLAVLFAIPKLSAEIAPQDDEKSKSSPTASAPGVNDQKQANSEFAKPSADELVGMVIDEDGNPVIGVEIDAWSWYPGNETRTDETGRFRLKFDDTGRKVELRVMKDGYSPFYNAQQPLGVPDFKVKLGKRTYIEGTVRDSMGSPVPNVEVRGEQGPQQADGVTIGVVVTKTQTDDMGRYRLFVHPDTYQLLVRTKSGQVARLTDVVVRPNEVKQQDIALKRGVRFEAHVVDSISGQPFSDLVLFHFMHAGVIGRSDTEGRITIEGMLPGEFEFNVGEGESQKLGPFTAYLPRSIGRWWSPQAKQASQREEVKAGQFQRNQDDLTFDLVDGMRPVTIYVEQGVTFSGRITDPDGNPVEGATVAPARTGTGNSLTGDTRYSVKTGADGRYKVVMPAGKDFEYNLIAHDGDYQQWRSWANGVTDPVRTWPGELFENMDIQLTRPATVRGRVLAEGDRNLGGREVRAHAKDLRENRYYDPTTRTNEDGSFELKFVRPGEHYIQVQPFWLAAADAPEGSTVRVSLQPGETVEGIELKVPASAQPVMPAVAQREFTVLLQDENGLPLPNVDVILSGHGRQANLNALSGDRRKLAERWKNDPIGGDVRKTDSGGKLKVSGSELFSEVALAVLIVAMDAEHGRAAIGSLLPDARTTEMTLSMQPLREIRVTFDDETLRTVDSENNQSPHVGLVAESALVFQQELKGHELVFHVPPGNYSLFAVHPLAELSNKQLKVEPTASPDGQIALALRFEKNRLAQMMGQDAPALRDIAAWQGGDPTTLEELRGKVVVLDFWGYWCGPCLAAMPELFKLHDEFHKEGLEIIAIHDSSSNSTADLNTKLEAPRKNLWNGRDLPFRVALAGNNPDEKQTAQGTAIADYGIREFPTTLLIDRAGKVVKRLYPNQAEENIKLIRELVEQ